MNQMIGSASTSMATMLNRQIDILPPDVDVWDNQDNIDIERFNTQEKFVKYPLI